MDNIGTLGGQAHGAARRPADTLTPAGMKGRWEFICRDANGVEKWRDTIDNIVVNAGLNYLLDAGLSAGSQITTWYLGLTSATPTVAAADVMNSHAGWTEVTAYDEANRVTWADGGVSAQSVSNTATPADFTISANGTDIGGAFLTSVNTKGGTTGTLYAAGAFTAGNKSLDDNDTIEVTFTATAAAA
jgi:hypothetical protein